MLLIIRNVKFFQKNFKFDFNEQQAGFFRLNKFLILTKQKIIWL